MSTKEVTAAEMKLRSALMRCLNAMDKSRSEGSTDHLDCSDDGGAFWHDAVEFATQVLKETE